MAYPKRGEIWLTDFEPSVGTEMQKIRPALVVSNDVFNRSTSKVTVLPFTSQLKATPVNVVVKPDTENNLEKISLIKVPDISTFDKGRLKRKLGTINNDLMKDVEEKLKLHLSLR